MWWFEMFLPIYLLLGAGGASIIVFGNDHSDSIPKVVIRWLILTIVWIPLLIISFAFIGFNNLLFRLRNHQNG